MKRAIALAALALAFAAQPVAAGTFRYGYVVQPGYTSGMANTHHDYPAADIMIDPRCGTRARAPIDGTFLEVERTNYWAMGYRGGAYRGGLFVSIRGVDGVRYYMSHFSAIPKGLAAGQPVTKGQVVGIVGKTGRAGSCHIHFGISPVCAGVGDWWIRRGVIWPQQYLRSWKKAAVADKSPRDEVAAWLATHGCPASVRDLPSSW